MTNAAFAAEIVKTCFKPLISGILSLSMAFSPVLPQNQGSFLKLAADSLLSDTGKVRIQVNYNIQSPTFEVMEDGESIDLEYSTENVSGDLDIYADIRNLILNVYLDEEKKNVFYIDTDGYATPPLIGKICALTEMDNNYYDYDYDEFDKAYTELSENGYYGESWEEYFEINFLGEFENRTNAGPVQATAKAFADLVALLSSEENVAKAGNIGKELYSFAEKYFYTEKRGETDGFGLYLDGMDILNLLYDSTAVITSEEYREAQDSFKMDIIDRLDIDGYAKALYGEDVTVYEKFKTKGGMYDFMSMVLPSMTYSTADEITEKITEIRSIEKFPDKALLEDIEALVGYFANEGYEEPWMEALELMGAYSIYEILSGSHIDLFIYPSEDDICLDIQLVLHTIDASEDFIADLKCTISDYDGELVRTESITNRYTEKDCISSIINKKAEEKGIYKTEIEWTSDFYHGYDVPDIYSEYIYVWYMEDDMKTIFSSAAFPKMSEENRANIISLFEEKYSYEYDYNLIDVKLMDNSTYLPLRQIAESCGLDVEWDSAEKKAYVIKDGTKTDMTGTLVGNKTYVKVRDFEKLGAKVEYEEDIWYEEEGEFQKSCKVTISFFNP